MKEFNVKLNEDQIRVLLAIIDCSTDAEEPDWFFDEENEIIMTPFLDANGKQIPSRSIQKHLNMMLVEDKYPQIFTE